VKYCPSAGECAPESGSAAVAMDRPMLAPIISAAITGAAKANCRAKPSASPITISPQVSSRPGSENSAAGAGIAVHAQSITARAPASTTRTCAGTCALPNRGAANSAAPQRVIRKTIRQNSASSGPKPKFIWIMARASVSCPAWRSGRTGLS
jgi:hypothetical protein